MSDMKIIIDNILKGDEDKVKLLTLEALSKGEKASEILNNGLIAGMDIVGEKMEAEDMFIPEVLMSAKAMSAGLEVLKPHLAEDESNGRGKVVIGTVQGDLHDIGKNLVKMLIEGAGFEVIDLGTNVETEKFISTAKENNADIIALSALLTTTMPVMKDIVDGLESAGIRDKVKVLVGGAPVTEEYAKEIGADGYGSDAGSAVRIAKSLV